MPVERNRRTRPPRTAFHDPEPEQPIEPSADDSDSSPPPAPPPTRRAFLGRAGAAAAGAVAGSVATAAMTAEEAHASTGDAIIAGDLTTTQTHTRLHYDAFGTPDSIFEVTDAFSAGPVANAAVTALVATGRLQTGVYGRADVPGGQGVRAVGGPGSIGLTATGLHADLKIGGNNGEPPFIRTDAHDAGELIFDGGGSLWLCTSGGSPGYWQRIGGLGTCGSLAMKYPPVRAYDSRNGYAPADVQKGAMADGEERTIDLTHDFALPPGSQASLINLTVTETSSAGWMAAWPNGLPYNGTSTVNWSTSGQTIANSTTVGLNDNGWITVRCSGRAHLIIDVIGFHR